MINNLYKQGAFLTVGDENKYNTMTISWGSVGLMWRKPMFMVMVRESRYSNEFLSLGKSYTVSIPRENEMKVELGICGSKSGRDIDKQKEANLKYIPAKEVKTPVVDGCGKYYECNIVFKQEMNLDNMSSEMREQFYNPSETKHVLYFGEIVKEY
jgi:flavin reductase (DIM6/NTAB) family NADH-FMN oxidoreductase RutF